MASHIPTLTEQAEKAPQTLNKSKHRPTHGHTEKQIIRSPSAEGSMGLKTLALLPPMKFPSKVQVDSPYVSNSTMSVSNSKSTCKQSSASESIGHSVTEISGAVAPRVPRIKLKSIQTKCKDMN